MYCLPKQLILWFCQWSLWRTSVLVNESDDNLNVSTSLSPSGDYTQPIFWLWMWTSYMQWWCHSLTASTNCSMMYSTRLLLCFDSMQRSLLHWWWEWGSLCFWMPKPTSSHWNPPQTGNLYSFWKLINICFPLWFHIESLLFPFSNSDKKNYVKCSAVMVSIFGLRSVFNKNHGLNLVYVLWFQMLITRTANSEN